jgi:hypothetical protein
MRVSTALFRAYRSRVGGQPALLKAVASTGKVATETAFAQQSDGNLRPHKPVVKHIHRPAADSARFASPGIDIPRKRFLALSIV